MKKIIGLALLVAGIGFASYVIKNNKTVSVETAKEFVEDVKNADATKSAIEAGKKAGKQAKKAIHEATK